MAQPKAYTKFSLPSLAQQLGFETEGVKTALAKNPEVKAMIEKQLITPNAKTFAADFKAINTDLLTPGLKKGRAELQETFSKLSWGEFFTIVGKFK